MQIVARVSDFFFFLLYIVRDFKFYFIVIHPTGTVPHMRTKPVVPPFW